MIMFAILLLAAGIVVANLMFGKNSLREQHHITRENAQYQMKIDSLQKVLDQGNETIERLKNDSLYIEEQLRTKYGMSRKGEKVFQFVR